MQSVFGDPHSGGAVRVDAVDAASDGSHEREAESFAAFRVDRRADDDRAVASVPVVTGVWWRVA